MTSLLGLASYDSDDSDGDEANANDDVQHSPSGNGSGGEGGALVGGATAAELLDENSDSRLGGESVGDDVPSQRMGNARTSSFDAPEPVTRESRQFFMPLPSPLVRLDNASSANSPFIVYDGSVGGGGGGVDEGGEGEEEKEEEGDGDIIDPEYRDMLPPEATGQANPQLQSKIAKFLDTMQGDFTKSIKAKKDFGNPAVLAQVGEMAYCQGSGTL